MSLIINPTITTLTVDPQDETIEVSPETTTITVNSDGVDLTVDTSPVELTVSPLSITINLEPQVITLTPSTGNVFVGGSGSDIVSLSNGWPSTITLGQVVYMTSSDAVRLAQANLDSTCQAIGLVADETIANSATGNIQTAGVLGGLTGLVTGSVYYLDPATAGAITTTPPSSP